MEKREKLIIFDLDGTLINSVKDLAAAVNYALQKRGYPTHEEEKFYHFVGDGVKKLIERALPGEYSSNEEKISEVKKDFDEYYGSHYFVYTKIYDNIPDVLLKLKARGYKLCVLSNKPHEFCTTIVTEFFPGVFDLILGGSDKFPKKPAPAAVYYIIEKFKADKADCAIIGDSDVDIITGKNSGIKTVGAAWGFRGEKELKAAGADYIVPSAEDITDILL